MVKSAFLKSNVFLNTMTYKQTYILFLQTMKYFIHDNNTHYYQDLATKIKLPIDQLKETFKFGKESGLITYQYGKTYFKSIEFTEDMWNKLVDDLCNYTCPMDARLSKDTFYGSFYSKSKRTTKK